jgi:hypothetical protein
VSKKQCDCAIDVTGDSRAVDLSKINWRQLIKKWYCSHRLLGLVVVVRMTPTESMQFEEANIHLASAKYPSPTIGGKVRRGRRMAHMEETVVTLMLSTFLIVDDSSELAAGDELTASDELMFTMWASTSATFSLRADDDTECEDLEDSARRTRWLVGSGGGAR